jgi:hypothetical protein
MEIFLFHDEIVSYREVLLTDFHDWITTSISLSSTILLDDIFGAFLEVYIAEFVG